MKCRGRICQFASTTLKPTRIEIPTRDNRNSGPFVRLRSLFRSHRVTLPATITVIDSESSNPSLRFRRRWLLGLEPFLEREGCTLRRVRARSGSFVLGASGSYDGAETRSAFEVIAGSRTGQFVGIAGSGKGATRRSSTGTYSFDFELPVAWAPHSVGDLGPSVSERRTAGVSNHG